ncbi:hypothetical protein DFJ74DRAFT_727642 [Hyaloraphidium curvatum]|nr:hypothetical protein DFJ74DRAFT_727642 [Hyaloraphidium curvatum]
MTESEPSTAAEGLAPREDRPAPAAPLRFSPAETAALFAADGAPGEVPPLTLPRMAADFDRAAPALAAAVGMAPIMRLFSTDSVGKVVGMRVFIDATWISILWALAPATGAFSTAAMAGTTVGVLLRSILYAGTVVGVVMAAQREARLGDADVEQQKDGPQEGLKSEDSQAQPGQMDHHALAPLARWLELAAGDSSSALLRHSSKDRAAGRCPCPSPSCGTSLVQITPTLVFSSFAVVFVLFFMAWVILLTWTQFFFLPTWKAPWAATLAAIYLLVYISTYLADIYFRQVTLLPPFSVIALERRLRLRAVDLTLDDLVSRCEASAFGGHPIPLPPPDDETYISLHRQLVSSWETRLRSYTASRSIVVSTAVGAVVVCLCNLFAGGCLTAYNIADVAVVAAFLAFDLLTCAAANRDIDGAAVAYSGAVERARMLVLRGRAARTDPHAPQPDDRAIAVLEAHAGMLASFANVGGLRTKFLGFGVTFGLVGTVAASGFTVAVGLWGVLRAVGTRTTLQSVCPIF